MVCHDDDDVIPTCDSLIRNAVAPDDVRIIVVLQTDEPERFERLSAFKQVEVHVYSLEWATGVGRPRALAVELLNEETHFLQVDCHSRFQPRWDELLYNELAACPKMSVLSALPPGFVIATGELLTMQSCIPKPSKFIEGVPLSDFHPVPNGLASPPMIPHIAAGLVFCEAEAIKAFPPDPYYHYHGEELSQSLRWWTNGYTLYGIRPCVIHHAYRGDNPRPKADNVNDVMLHWRSIQRIKALFGHDRAGMSPKALANIGSYELGTVRTLASWEEAFGVNLKTQTFA